VPGGPTHYDGIWTVAYSNPLTQTSPSECPSVIYIINTNGDHFDLLIRK